MTDPSPATDVALPSGANAEASVPDWFTEARFGMFIHWGVYALAARHEWVMTREEMDTATYQRYLDHFEVDRYDPRDWARRAREAGMRYVVITAKHHDGFCLWDSDLTDWSVASTPHGRDLLGPFVEACRAEGLRIGFYYSLLDWHHPDFTVDGLHPLRNGDVEALNTGRDLTRYREYLHGQVRELLTRYAPVSYLFFDFSYSDDDHKRDVFNGKGAAEWGSEELLAMCRELQPDIIVNDRLDVPGDLVSPEQYQPLGPMTVSGRPVPWEACQTLNGSWGYDRDELHHKSPELLVRMLVDGVSNGGNLLLNVAPDGRGALPPVVRDTLAGIGDWMELHERSIRGAGPVTVAVDVLGPSDVRLTQRGDRLYLHLFAWPMRHVHLGGLGGRVAYAQLLHDGSEIRYTEADPTVRAYGSGMGGLPAGAVTFELPVLRPDVLVPVVEIFLREQG
ncbi:alpha-L-fucosidase [Desertihabitans aurantiacus]|uniref:alpha-L-fucosidase n=1 Tax=Desertihabitans aurantiacus TaxID=2282477 RepID=UPI000DF75134|nr:alpha-L-fucosidase [Desertihabitans aurantiacus]